MHLLEFKASNVDYPVDSSVKVYIDVDQVNHVHIDESEPDEIMVGVADTTYYIRPDCPAAKEILRRINEPSDLQQQISTLGHMIIDKITDLADRADENFGELTNDIIREWRNQ